MNDVAMCTLGDCTTVPCRLLEVFWGEEEGALLMSVRRFRTTDEVRDAGGVGGQKEWHVCGRRLDLGQGWS